MLTWFPIRCACGRHSYASDVPDFGAIHPLSRPCPLASGNFRRGQSTDCCDFSAETAAMELDALGQDVLALLFHNELSAEQASLLASQLFEVADRLESEHAHDDRPPQRTAPRVMEWDADGGGWKVTRRSSFVEALASICEAARWLDAVGGAGFAVRSTTRGAQVQ